MPRQPFEELSRHTQQILDFVSFVITYPKGFNLPRIVTLNTNGVENVFRDHNANNYIEKIKNLKPDLIFVAGWSGLLSEQILEIPPMGVIGFHP